MYRLDTTCTTTHEFLEYQVLRTENKEAFDTALQTVPGRYKASSARNSHGFPSEMTGQSRPVQCTEYGVGIG